MNGVDPNMVIGAGTEVISGEGKILTAGGVDTHIHFICPQQMEVALSSGVTTLWEAEQDLLQEAKRQHVRLAHGIWQGCWKRPRSFRLMSAS